MSPELVYKILADHEWRTGLAAGRYEGSALDRADGYIHLSSADQVEGTLARHFAGRGDLVVIGFDAAALAGLELRWEPSRGGALFPHLYAALPIRPTDPVWRAHWDGARHTLTPQR